MAEIYNRKSNSLVSGTSGDDYVENGTYLKNCTINTGDGNDYVLNLYSSGCTINTGTGIDSVYNHHGNNCTINTGAGNDSINNWYSDNCSIDTGKGNDSIRIDSESSKCTINTGVGNDSVVNSGVKCTINTGDGKDTVYNESSNCSINTGSGNDSIYNYYGDECTIDTGAGKDTVYITESNDFKINTGDGNDSVYNGWGDNCTINTGAGNDLISLNSAAYENVIIYNSGDGNDIIYGFRADSTLSISGNSYSSIESGKDIIVTVDDGEITLVGAASLSAVHIKGKKASTATNKWKLDGTTATYGTSSKTLVTVKGVKSLDGLSIKDKVVTVSKSSLNAKKVTISGDGYTLALADDVTAPTSKKAAWSYKSGTATYKSSYKTAGYTLASNGKSISYSKATKPSTLATVKGATSKSGLSVSGKKITLKNSALKNKVTVSGSYEFDFAKDYGTATITGSSKADTITARGKKISVNGGAGDDTIKILGSGTVSGGDGADIFYYKSSGSNVIADYAAEDKISIASGTAATSTSGNDLILTVGSGKISVTGGANQTVTYFDANGEHIYKKSSDTLEGVKFTKSGKVVTLTDDYEADKFDVADFSNYKNKIVTINAANVSQALEIIGNKKSNVITGTGTDDYIDGGAGADSIKGGNGNDIIYGGTDNDSILGGNGSDTLYGGAGNDSLWGGAGSDSIYGGLGDDYLVGGDGRDIFVYNNGDGHDYIDDYEQGVDKIMILSGEKPYIDRTNLSNDVTYIIGEGSLVIKNGINTTIEFVDSNNRLIDKSTPSKAG